LYLMAAINNLSYNSLNATGYPL